MSPRIEDAAPGLEGPTSDTIAAMTGASRRQGIASSGRDDSELRLHEAVCAERYANLLALLQSTMVRVGRLEFLVVIVAGSVICGMAGIIFTLALKLGAH